MTNLTREQMREYQRARVARMRREAVGVAPLHGRPLPKDHPLAVRVERARVEAQREYEAPGGRARRRSRDGGSGGGRKCARVYPRESGGPQAARAEVYPRESGGLQTVRVSAARPSSIPRQARGAEWAVPTASSPDTSFRGGRNAGDRGEGWKGPSGRRL
jgi:hypothetical protein